jgi:ADP-heptose:LPS heptosyltransferase
MAFREELEDAVKLISFQLIYYLVRCIPSKPKKKNLLLVKTDEIGDYVLIRNFLGVFRKSSLFRDHSITFIGSVAYRDLFEAYDSDVADQVIWLDKKRFRRNMMYRFSLLRKVRKAGFSDAVNLVYSRSFRIDDLVIAVSTAAHKTGMESAHLPASKVERLLTPRDIYHILLDPGGQSLFEACKNARFIGQLLNVKIEPVSVRIDAVADISTFSLPKAYFIIVPGSGHKEKTWSAASFSEVARFMTDHYGLMTVVCGSNGDKTETDEFIRTFDRPVTDLTGKTSLPQLLAVLKSAQCLISVDTGAVHLAAAVGCPVYGLFSGLHYGRFAPYPMEIAREFTAIYPDEIDEQVRTNNLSDINNIPVGLLRKIPPEKVINSIRKNFSPH